MNDSQKIKFAAWLSNVLKVPIDFVNPAGPVTILKDSTSNEEGQLSIAAMKLSKISEEGRHSLFTYTLPYTARAFGEDMNTMTPESKQEHFEHLTGGDLLAVACIRSPSDPNEFIVLSHSLFTEVVIDAKGGFALHLNGIACDPQNQSSGVATTLLQHVVPAAGGCYFSLRTQNPKILRIMKKVVGGEGVVYPVDATPSEQISNVAGVVSARIPDRDSFDSATLIYRKVYPPDRAAVFSSPTAAGMEHVAASIDKIINRSEGDALLLVAKFP